MAMALKRNGFDQFTIYERAERIGGTWRDNTYPGAACDIPSHLYCYSSVPNPHWTRKYAEQPEILAYLQYCTDRFGLGSQIRYSTEIEAAAYDDNLARWTLVTTTGEKLTADVVITATGQLSRPFIPAIPGLERFDGATFHSAAWDHDHDLRGRQVGIVGNGASAIQFVPHVANQAERVTIFQRSANYVAPKPDRAFSILERWLFEHIPVLDRLYRLRIYLAHEHRWFAFRAGSRANEKLTRELAALAEAEASNGLPASAVVPDFPIGCKRILISNDYYPALHQQGVQITTAPIDRIEPHGIVTADGETHSVDTIIFGTGFVATRFLGPMKVSGVGGCELDQAWQGGAEAHLGMTLTGFPNLFMLYGPNTNLGHNSILIMVERQIRYVLRCLRWLVTDDLASVEVRPEVMADSNRRLQSRLARSVWMQGCTSWYKTASGKVTQNWPGSAIGYGWATLRVRRDQFVARHRSTETAVSILRRAGRPRG